MRIMILAPGSRGDIQPYLALGKGLKAAGHSPRIVTNLEFAGLVASHGLECRPMDLGVQAALQSSQARAAIEGGSVLASFRELSRLARKGSAILAREGLEAALDADLVLVGFGGLFMGASIAEKLDLPLVQAYNVPLSPTGDFPGALLPYPKGRAPRFLNRLGHGLTREVLWQTARSSGEPARREVLGLGPSRATRPFGQGKLAARPVLYGISPSVIPRPGDWEAGLELTGYWFLDRAPEWSPPPALLSFLERGPAPVYIGFGSMSHRDPERTMDLVLEALRLAGVRAVLSSGWGGLKAADLPPELFLAEDLPHDWLFPRMAAAVHHGGAGTTAAGLRAGLPSVLVPFHGDQPFWGRMVAALGVGPSPLPRRSLTASMLARAIGLALEDQAMRERAALLGERIRAEDGVGRAVELLERHW